MYQDSSTYIITEKMWCEMLEHVVRGRDDILAKFTAGLWQHMLELIASEIKEVTGRIMITHVMLMCCIIKFLTIGATSLQR